MTAHDLTGYSRLLADLADLFGPVGHEHLVADHLEALWVDAGLQVSRTRVGNVVGHLPGSGPRLMLQAHMDEMSLTVRSITEDGFLFLGTSGRGGLGTLPESLNLHVSILGRAGMVDGLVARVTGHHRGAVDTLADFDRVFIDLGVHSRAAVEALGVHVGAPVVYNAVTRRLGDAIVGKAFDDRVGLAIMTAAVLELRGTALPWDLTLVGTVQEETGGIGAASLRADLGAFDAAVAYEIGPAGDYPGLSGPARHIGLGRGVVFGHEDQAVHYDVPLTNRLIGLASEHGIPFQDAAFTGYGTDGMMLLMQGIPTALVAVPTRYTHSPYEMIATSDFEDAIRLTVALLSAPPV